MALSLPGLRSSAPNCETSNVQRTRPAPPCAPRNAGQGTDGSAGEVTQIEYLLLGFRKVKSGRLAIAEVKALINITVLETTAAAKNKPRNAPREAGLGAGAGGRTTTSSSFMVHRPASSRSSSSRTEAASLAGRRAADSTCWRISSSEAVTSSPVSAAQSSARRGFVVPVTWGYGHSRGND